MPQSLRYSFRLLRKSPGFTLVTILTLALGIGANTAIFSVVHAALLRSLPYWQPSRLMTLGETRQKHADESAQECSYPDYLDLKRTASSFQSFGGYSGDAFTMTAVGDPKNMFATQVTPGFFSTLGVRPVLGRDFLENEMTPSGIPHVAIISFRLWRAEFSSDPNVVGRVIRLDSKPVTIVGVLPREFEFAPAGSANLWVPLHPSSGELNRRSLRWLHVIARLAAGVSSDQARAQMAGIMAQLARAYPRRTVQSQLSWAA